MNATFTLGDLVQLIGLFVVLGGVIGHYYRGMASLHSRISELKDELHAFQIQAAEKYATYDVLKDVEQKFVDEVVRINKRLDDLLKISRNGH